MSTQRILIALIAGASSAALFVALFAQALPVFPFLMLVPLPISIVGLGWGSITGFIAALFAFIGISLLSSPLNGLFFSALFSLPMAYLAHLTGLTRQDNANQTVEWFPESTILWRTIIVGGVIIGLTFIIFGFNAEQITQQVIGHFATELEKIDETSRNIIETHLAFHVRHSPYSMPMIWFFVMALNLWLGIWIAKKSELFARPSFRLANAELHGAVMLVFFFAFIVSRFFPPFSLIGSAFVGIVAMAFIMLGLNTIHIITSHLKVRGLLLTSFYLATFLLFFPIIIIVLGVGFADHFLKIRQRYRLAHPNI